MKQIDLKKTIDNAKYVRQIDVAKDFGTTKQHVHTHYATNKMTSAQNVAYILYFEKNNIDIIYK